MYIQATGNAGNKRRQKQHTKREEKKKDSKTDSIYNDKQGNELIHEYVDIHTTPTTTNR